MSRTAASGGGGAAPQIGGYRIEYITSGKARCNGPKPCNGTFIENGALCLAVQVTINFSTNWHRKHWGCVTPRVIKNLKNAIAHPQDLDGYDALRAEDQAKVVSAWDAGYIADDVVTESLLEPGTGSADTVQTASVPGASVAAIEVSTSIGSFQSV
ncbi:hypothetical protein BKA62DRAFT_625520 [Auriculariales sp. MPI-PUGE-AT-0066]|nr:hypothetical protein BKA62DRAFT_625520 [Auriculariales sp. MPI-PUGE-AT-0066]